MSVTHVSLSLVEMTHYHPETLPVPPPPFASEAPRYTSEADLGGRMLRGVENNRPVLQTILSYLDLRDKARCKSVHSVYARTLMGPQWRERVDPAAVLRPLVPDSITTDLNLATIGTKALHPLLMHGLLGQGWRERVAAARAAHDAPLGFPGFKRQRRCIRELGEEPDDLTINLVQSYSDADEVEIDFTFSRPMVVFRSVPAAVRVNLRRGLETLGPLRLPLSDFGPQPMLLKRVVLRVHGAVGTCMKRAMKGFLPLEWVQHGHNGAQREVWQPTIVRQVGFRADHPPCPLLELLSVLYTKAATHHSGVLLTAKVVEVDDEVTDVPRWARKTGRVTESFLMLAPEFRPLEHYFDATYAMRPLLQPRDLDGLVNVTHLRLSEDHYWSLGPSALMKACPRLGVLEAYTSLEAPGFYVDEKLAEDYVVERPCVGPHTLHFRSPVHRVMQLAPYAPFFANATRVTLVLADPYMLSMSTPRENQLMRQWFGTRSTHADVVIMAPSSASAQFLSHLLGVKGGAPMTERNERYFAIRCPDHPIDKRPLLGEPKIRTYCGVTALSLAQDL